jgi:hypothetical protein
MTAMIHAVKNILTTPLFAEHDEVDGGVWVTRWTESRPLPPALPSWEDGEMEDLFDGLFNSAA